MVRRLTVFLEKGLDLKTGVHDVISSTHAAHATALKGQHWSVHIPDFTEKLKRSEKSSTTDVISTLTRTQRKKDGMGSNNSVKYGCCGHNKHRAFRRVRASGTCRTQTELKTSNAGKQGPSEDVNQT